MAANVTEVKFKIMDVLDLFVMNFNGLKQLSGLLGVVTFVSRVDVTILQSFKNSAPKSSDSNS